MVLEARAAAMTGTWNVDSTDIASVMAAKASVMAFLRARGPEGAPYEDCALALAELLSNAVRHAHPGPIVVSLDWTSSRPVLAVTNEGAAFAMCLEKPPFDRESGRGLYILAHVLETPIVESEEGRCRVSLSLPVTKV
jgi:anti-sigma regulatory factor (Ser/Thr protein kinase)